MPNQPVSPSYRRLLRYLKPYRATLFLAMVASLGAAGAGALYAYLVGPLLKSMLSGGQVRLGPVALEGAVGTWGLPAAVVAVAVLKATSQWLQGGWMNAVGQQVMRDLRRDLYGHLLSLSPRFFETRHSGELLSRFTADVAQVEFSVSQALGSYVKDTLQVLALMGACLFIDVRLFFLAFVILPGAVVPVSRFAKSLKKVARRTQGSLGQLTQLAAEQLNNLPVVQAFRGTERALSRFDQEQGRYLQAMQRSLFIRGAFTPTVEVLGVVGAAVAIGAGAQAISTEPELSGKLLSFLAASLMMYQPLKALSGTFSLVVQGMGAADRLFEVTDAEPMTDEGQDALPLEKGLSIEGLCLSYDGTRQALLGLSLEIPAGKKVALVGASGAGKSSLFSVLLGFAAPTGGQARWDGTALGDLKLSSLRHQMAWVPQEPVLFSGTVRQNLLLGKPEATEAELWEALRHAHAEGFVRALPAALEEQVGERGSRLSGGQKQRLAIARAFLRKPSLLLLDEPTSALDAHSEREVQAGLEELMQGRTTLVIAHRLSTVRQADLIYVLEAGRQVEHGTHAELVALGGRYAALLQHGDLAAA